MSDSDKRQELRERIELAEERNALRAAEDYPNDAKEAAVSFIRANPIASVAGAAAIGLVIGSFIPGKKLSGRSSALLASVADLGLAYGVKMMETASEAAQAGQDKFEDLSDAIGDEARSLKREAGYRGGKAADAARSLAREAGKKASRGVRDIGKRVSH